MTRQLVFVHGRCQQHKDGGALKQEWIDCWSAGLKKADLKLPVTATDVHFPYYGDTLDQLSHGIPIGEAAKIIIKGKATPAEETFTLEILDDIREKCGISDEDLHKVAGRRVTEKGIQNWPFVLAVLRALDELVPAASSQAVALFTQDVYDYLTNEDIRNDIDGGFADAMNKASQSGDDVIVVAHSLGTIVAYNALLHHPDSGKWTVPLLVTVGSPLGISAINTRIRSLGAEPEQRIPPNVQRWFNAMDARDIVALYPLDKQHFELDPANPPITNKTDVDNDTENRHGISGYLGDMTVAETIRTAVTAS
jgi:hypothetical protein